MIRPELTFGQYTWPGGKLGAWFVHRRGIEVALSQDPAAALAAMRLIGGPEAIAAFMAYLTDLGFSSKNHPWMKAIEDSERGRR